MANIHHNLSLRLTHGYVGTYKHLDKWHDIGIAVEVGREDLTVIDDLEDPCEPTHERVYLRVKLDDVEPFERVQQAIRDTFSAHGCAHEYDCCGCRSFSCYEVTHEGGAIWSAEVNSSRNF